MFGGNPLRKEHRFARWTARVVVLTVLAGLLVAVFSGVAAAAWPNPVLVGSVTAGPLGSRPWSVCVQGGYAYVANYGSRQLQVFDVSGGGTPSLASYVETGTDSYPSSVCVQGGYAYVVNIGSIGPDKLMVFDVSNPLSPPINVMGAGVGVTTRTHPNSVCVQGGYVYVVNGGVPGLMGLRSSTSRSPPRPTRSALSPQDQEAILRQSTSRAVTPM